MSTTVELSKARNLKKDEFYTQIEDVEKELINYIPYFKNKIIYCNCDNPNKSAFWKYLHLNFTSFKLKALIATYYNPNTIVYKMEYKGGNDSNIKESIVTPLKGNGDFRSDECIKILNQSDIIITNPPFSLFRQYLSQLVYYNKKFIILGNMNAVTYKEVFPLIRDNKIWYGVSIHSGDRKFEVPDSYPLTASNCGINENGQKYVCVKGIRWFTNLDHNKRHSPIILTKTYSSDLYPYYDNYKAININKTSDIPKDYYDLMGVPISFLDKYCPDQFKIIGNEYTLNLSKGRGYINGKRLYSRIFIKRITLS